MPRLTINTAEAVSFEPAEPGPYLMSIDTVSEPVTSKEKGTRGVNIEFKFADADMDQRCGKIRRFYPIAGKGAGFFADLYRVATGNEIPVGKEGGDLDIDTDDLLGKVVTVEVGHREYEGRTFNEAQKVVAA